jgi:hypothetical protein
MREAAPFFIERVRRIPKSFSWIDRRLIHDNVLPYLAKDELVLYFFLTTVSNKDGVSYYGPNKIGLHTGLSPDELNAARAGLEELDLIAYRFPFYQVLSLPDKSSWAGISMRRFQKRATARGREA